MEKRQISVRISGEADRQLRYLQDRGFGTITGIFHLAIDRLYREEAQKESTQSQHKQDNNQ